VAQGTHACHGVLNRFGDIRLDPGAVACNSIYVLA